MFRSINPKNLELIQEYSLDSKSLIHKKIELAQQAYHEWRKTDFSYRKNLLLKLKEELNQNKQNYAVLISNEMGKPILQSMAEIEKCQLMCEYYAENAEKFLSPEKIQSQYEISEVHHRPLGIVFSIMPWNFPFWQVLRFACPAIMAGNSVLLKHAENVCGSSLAIAKIFQDAGYPLGLFQSLICEVDQVEEIIAHSHVRAVTLTGSTQAGRSVASLAGQYLKKTVLELGGSDPYLILEDANIKLAVKACAKARMLNAGQSCISPKRLIVCDSVYNDFRKEFLDEFSQIQLGDPLEKTTDMGPMARMDLKEKLISQLEKSLQMGAKKIFGESPRDAEAAFFPPTVIENITRDMPAYNEELFGPVAVLIRAKDREDALQIANESEYGLGAAIFSQNIQKSYNTAIAEIDSGSCFVNDFCKSDPKLPFGGIKNSGYGRELSRYGILEFTNTKSICLAKN